MDEHLHSPSVSRVGSFSSSSVANQTIDPQLERQQDPTPERQEYLLRKEPIWATMDRNEGIIRWSPNVSRSDFLVINLKNQVVQLYEATGFAQPGKFDYNKVSKHADFPPVNTYDWSPTVRGLVAIGTSHGDVHLLRVDDNSSARFNLPQKLQRPIQSVAFNSQGLLAVGLDRIRNDSCLQIWDINQRLADWDSSKKGWGGMPLKDAEPVKKLEGSTSITSIRFFEDNPNTLVTGIKNQSVRVHDLRDPHSSVITFQTKCCNNIAIDYNDQNYFASSTLDQPGFSIWDKRVASRSTASPMYLETFDEGSIAWGSVLKLDSILQSSKNVPHSSIKQLRYSREQRGCLGVLSTAGQLQIFQTRKEYVEAGSSDDIQGSARLLEVKKTYDLEYAYFDEGREKKYDQRIVSFDWVNAGSSALQGRVLALRGNGEVEIVYMPASTNNHIEQFMPWKAPHHIGDPYWTLPKFENIEEAFDALGPLYTSVIEATLPVFGPNRITSPKVAATMENTVRKLFVDDADMVIDLIHQRKKEPADNLAKGIKQLDLSDRKGKGKTTVRVEGAATEVSTKKTLSSLEIHDLSHYTTRSREPLSKEEHAELDNTMACRAVAGYLFDVQKNIDIVAGDQWLQGVWEWVANAERLSKDDGMVSLPLDLSYLGVFTLWTNELGAKPQSRIIEATNAAGGDNWEKLIEVINRKANRIEFQSIQTDKPQHRSLCLATLGLLQSIDEMAIELNKLKDEGKITAAAARALFRGERDLAAGYLMDAGNDLMFMGVTLGSMVPGTTVNAKFAKTLEEHPLMAVDPYFRAIVGYLLTADWATIVEEDGLPMRDRVGVALKNYDDEKLTAWLSKEMELAIQLGDVEGIFLAGITDNMVDIFAKYIEKFLDMQTPMLVLSYCYPRFIDDYRCKTWRKVYQDYLQQRKMFIPRVKFEVHSAKKSRERDGNPVIKPPPRQVTLRCLNCDFLAANDLHNTGAASTSTAGPPKPETRNPLHAVGIHAGLCCPKCGAHFPRCAVCMEIVGVPRSDRPELSTDPKVRQMANRPTVCLMCKHVTHMDHARAWFKRHRECPVPECRCQCNADARKREEE